MFLHRGSFYVCKAKLFMYIHVNQKLKLCLFHLQSDLTKLFSDYQKQLMLLLIIKRGGAKSTTYLSINQINK